MQSSVLARAARRLSALALMAAIGGSGGMAAADPPAPAYWLYDGMATTPFQQGQVYLGVSIKAGVQQLPRFNANFSVFDLSVFGQAALVAPHKDFSPELLVAQPGGELGYVFPDGTLPPWLGSRVRVGLFGSASFGRRTLQQSTAVDNTLDLVWAPLSGGVISATYLDGSTSFQEELQIVHQGFKVGLKAESDLALGPNLSLTPGIAIFGGHARDSYKYSAFGTSIAQGPVGPVHLNERLNTTEIGGHVSAKLTWQVYPGVAVLAGGTAGPVWMRTRLSGEDCFPAVYGLVFGAQCGPSLASGFVSSSASDRESALGFRGTASLGAAVDLRYAVLSLGGFVRYDTHIPGVHNPQVRDYTPPPGQVHGDTARVRFDDGFAYGGFVTVRVPIP